MEWLKDLTKLSARCVLPHSIPFMFAILHAFTLMVAMAERPGRSNYGMISNALDLDLNDAEGRPGLTECTGYPSTDECLNTCAQPGTCRCIYFPKRQCMSVCSFLNTNKTCHEFPYCVWSGGDDWQGMFWKRTTENCTELPSCSRMVRARGQRVEPRHFENCMGNLGFRGYRHNSSFGRFTPGSNCTFESFSVGNPIDCMGDGQDTVALVVNSSATDPAKTLECRRYKKLGAKPFWEQCLGEESEPRGVHPMDWKDEVDLETVSWARFGDEAKHA